MNKPHITQLLKLLDKPALLKWANKIGLQGIEIDSYRNSVMKEGTSLHKQIEDFVLKDIPFNDIKNQKLFIENIYSKVKFLGIEQPIETEYFTGRYDAKITIKDTGEIYLIDWKTQKDVYFENILQLVAYRMAEVDCSLAVILLPSFTFKKINIIDYKPYEEIINALSIIHQNRKLVDKWYNWHEL